MEGKEESKDFYNSAQNPGSLAAKKNTVPKPHHNSFLSLENFGTIVNLSYLIWETTCVRHCHKSRKQQWILFFAGAKEKQTNFGYGVSILNTVKSRAVDCLGY